MTAAQTPAEGSQIVYRIKSSSTEESAMTADNAITPTTADLLGALLKLACELRSDYRAATAAQTAALNRLAAAIEDATDAQVLNA